MIPDPFPHVVLDGWADPALCHSAAEEWPGPDWPHWINYRDECQSKSACPNWNAFPTAVTRLLSQMLLLPLADWFGGPKAVPDSLLWGGGMHTMGRGGVLGAHLDHSHHPLTGLQRAYSAVLFLNAGWDDNWGGGLALHAPDMAIARTYSPTFNRLVVFRTTDAAYHSVAGPLTCPAGVSRKSLAVFFHAAPTASPSRRRATFYGTHVAPKR